MRLSAEPSYRWLRTGDAAFGAMAGAIDAAARCVKFETYIYSAAAPGDTLLQGLVRAGNRGLRVQVLIDSFGSLSLPDSFWDPLRAAGGEMRWFNPLSLNRFNLRNHRKLLVCDDEVAFIGGFNVAPEWMGDGVAKGWRDLGLQLTGPLTRELSASFDEMFALAAFRHRRFPRLRRSASRRRVVSEQGELLLSGPGRGFSPMKRALRRDLTTARHVRIIAAYFLPPQRLRRAMNRVARRGGSVQLVLPGQSDVPLLQAATRSLYQRMLRAGIGLYEYQPQILHTKFILIDDVVYLGSSNLDPRSFSINYELLVRWSNGELAEDARQIFAEHLAFSRPIERTAWRKSRSFCRKLKERLAWFLFTRIDPYLTRQQLRYLR